MGSKGSTTTQTQNQSQSQSYAPTGAGYLTNALDRASSAASQPFAIPQAPVAGFSNDQQQAFQQYRDAQGSAQPYYNQAAGYYSPQGAQDFLNPYSANVMAGLKDVFGQQTSQNTGKLTQQAGGVGADRIAVGQAELAKQQGLVAGQTLSGMYDNAVRQAQSAGQGQMALGQNVMNSNLTGAGALYGAGQQQQQLEQQRLNSPYQQQLAQAAFPYQQAQFLSGITGSLAPGLGGTTSGYSNMQGTKTTPGPSLFSQILGGGTAALGAFGGAGGFSNAGWSPFGSSPAYGGGNMWDGRAYGGNSQAPLPGLSASDYGTGFASGGFVNPYADGGEVSDDPDILEQIARAMHGGRDLARRKFYNETRAGLLNSETAPERGHTYGGTGLDLDTRRRLQMYEAQDIARRVRGYDEGGAVSDDPIDISGRSIIPTVETPAAKAVTPQLQFAPMAQESSGGSGSGGKGGGPADIAKLAMMFINRGGRVNGYAEGGEIDDESPATFDERFPYRMPDAGAMDNWRANAPSPDVAAAPVMAFSGDDASASPAARAVDSFARSAPSEASANPYSAASAAPASGGSEKSESFASSPWAALMSAGLGMMGGTSPFAGVNIGQGGLQGLKTLEAQRAAAQRDETIAQAARRLEIEAKHHEDQYTRMTPYQKAQVARAEQAAAVDALKPVQIGQNAYGQPIYAKRNPKTGEYEPIQLPGQQPAPAAPSAPAPSPGAAPTVPGATGQDDAAIPVNARPTQGLLPNGTFGPVEPVRSNTNPDALEGMRPNDAAMVKAIAEGRQKFLALGRNNPRNQYIMEKVHEYDPSVDETAFSRRQRTANFFAVGTQGGGGQNITAMNTFGQHADELLRLSDELKMGRYPTLNALRTGLAKQGLSEPEIQKKLGAWEVASKAVADEGAKVFAGSNSALADREAWGSKFDVNNPQSVTREKLKEVVKLIEGRLNALTNQYNEGMRTTHDAKDFIAPRTKEIFDRISSGKEEKGSEGGPKVGERKQFRQGWGRWDGKQWVPEQ